MAFDFDEIINRRIPGDIKYMPVNGRVDILPLWVADMDFRAPDCVRRALIAQAEYSVFGYQIPDKEYDSLVCEWQRKQFQWSIKAEWLIKTPGVMFAVSSSIKALTNEGDGVLIFQPVYPPFANVVKHNKRQLFVSELYLNNGRFVMDFADVESQLSKGTIKALLFCSPHNPVGRVWEKEEMEQLAALCLRYDVKIISDEIHADFVYPNSRHIPFASLSEDIAASTVTCTAPTKTFNLASIQVSNMIISNDSVRHAVQAQVYATGYSSINSMAIAACKAVYRDGKDWLDELIRYLAENRRILTEAFPSDRKIRISAPEGTYLAWLDFRSLRISDNELNRALLYTSGVRLNTGESFGKGGSGFMRLNFACPHSTLIEAIKRIKTIL